MYCEQGSSKTLKMRDLDWVVLFCRLLGLAPYRRNPWTGSYISSLLLQFLSGLWVAAVGVAALSNIYFNLEHFKRSSLMDTISIVSDGLVGVLLSPLLWCYQFPQLRAVLNSPELSSSLPAYAWLALLLPVQELAVSVFLTVQNVLDDKRGLGLWISALRLAQPLQVCTFMCLEMLLCYLLLCVAQGFKQCNSALGALLPETEGALPPGTVRALPPGTVGALPPGTVGALPPGTVRAFRRRPVGALSGEALPCKAGGTLPQGPVGAMPLGPVRALPGGNLQREAVGALKWEDSLRAVRRRHWALTCVTEELSRCFGPPVLAILLTNFWWVVRGIYIHVRNGSIEWVLLSKLLGEASLGLGLSLIAETSMHNGFHALHILHSLATKSDLTDKEREEAASVAITYSVVLLGFHAQ